MNYGNCENELAFYLTTCFENENLKQFFVCCPIPDNETEANRFYQQINLSKVAIQYVGSTYLSSTSVDVISVVEKVKFRFIFEGRKLRGDGGIYNLIEFVKKKVTGYPLNDVAPMVPVRYDMLEVQQNVFQPYLEFECQFYLIQNFSPRIV
ncbi:Gp37 protein [Chitinophaga skermanii]|uniref:Gp37 protein n=1 Tax=Chitinophaga skermanii TaxID=331697 RepID=A0A327Q798_9BACT|nr:Gp37 family protein [Chitinophaga skermanii]RAJ00466.1 Gp37 protein [Chitinophaga skermanii]